MEYLNWAMFRPGCFALLVMLAGCATKPAAEQKDRREAPETTSETEKGLSLEQQKSAQQALSLAVARYPAVPAKELSCLRDDFHKHFHVKKADDTIPIPNETLLVNVASLREGMALARCTDPSSNGVVVHLGLAENNYFAVALEFVCLKPGFTGFDYEPSTRYYIPSATGQWQEVTGLANDWKGKEKYRTDVVVMNDASGPFREFQDFNDVNSVVYLMEQLEKLIEHNGGNIIEALGIVPIAGPRKRILEPHLKEEDFHQSISWLPMGVALDDIEDESMKPKFANKAANLGSPCPHQCARRIAFRTEGEPRRPGC